VEERNMLLKRSAGLVVGMLVVAAMALTGCETAPRVSYPEGKKFDNDYDRGVWL